MNKFIIALACLAVCANAKPSGLGGLVLKGPSGIVTSHGAIGPNGATSDDHDDGQWRGDGGWGHGGGWGGWDGGLHSNVVLGNGAVSVGAGVGHGLGLGVGHGLGLGVGLGHGVGLGWGGVGVGLGGVGLGGWGGHGVGGVVVKGPPTAPAVIIGPGKTGKVVADGLWGPTNAWGHGGHGGW